MCNKSDNPYNNSHLRELTEKLGESAGIHLPTDIDTPALNNMFVYIHDEFNSTVKRAERVRDMKFRLLASSKKNSPQLISTLMSVNQKG